MMKIDDIIISIAYFWIPIQIVVALANYPRLTSMPLKIWGLLVMVALFFFLCGSGHFMRAMDLMGPNYRVLNWMTAVVSFAAALYSLPLVPVLISSLDQSLEDLVKKSEETEESKRKLLTFMSFLCHEVRNPLFAITSAITFLEEDSLTEQQQCTVATISQSAELMLRLVNDVLDLSKLESGKLEVEERCYDLMNLLEGVIATAHTQVIRKHGEKVEFRSCIDANVPKWVSSDSARLLQIVYNLLSNANKFTSEGYIQFSVSTCTYSQALKRKLIKGPNDDDEEDEEDHSSNCRDFDESDEFVTRLLNATEEGHRSHQLRSDANTVVLNLKVADTGIGISPDRVKDVFQPYSQAKMSDYRKHGGTGLGLSIVAKLARIMGGTIHVSSKEYKGTTFEVHLPVRKCEGSRNSSHDDNNVTSLSVAAAATAAGLNTDNDAVDHLHDDDGKVDDGRAVPTPISPCYGLDAPKKKSYREYPLSDTTTMVQPTQVARGGRSPSSPTRQLPTLDMEPNNAVVLVVDDNEMNRKLLGRMLENINVEYELAGDGQEAVDIMAKSRNVTGDVNAKFFKLILMDMQMPRMDGCEATEKLRAQKLTLPIVALTANALDEWKQKALQAGATDFATKPILRDDLYAKCRKYLTKRTAPDNV